MMLFGIDLKKRGKLLTIIINDEEIDRQIAKLIIESEKTVRDLQQALRKKDIPEKDVDVEDLIKLFEKTRDKVRILISDVKSIRLSELQEKNYIKIYDEKYLLDKIGQLEILKNALDSLIEIMNEHPSDQEFEKGILNQVFENLNRIIDSLNKIKADDDQLREMYEKINR